MIDALSTIMWPSIVQSEATNSADTTDTVAAAAAARKSRMQREMEELERWFRGDKETSAGVKYTRGKPEGQQHPGSRTRRGYVSEDARRGGADRGREDMMTPPTIRHARLMSFETMVARSMDLRMTPGTSSLQRPIRTSSLVG